MTTKMVQRGEVLDWANATGSTVLSGAVVTLKHCVGIALTDIANGAVGAVAIKGCFTVPKVTASAIAAGEKLLWDLSALKFDNSAATPATGDIMGCAIAMAAGINGDTTIVAQLTPGNNTLT